MCSSMARGLLIHSEETTPGTTRRGLFSLGLPVQIKKKNPTFFHSGYMTCPSQSYRFNHSRSFLFVHLARNHLCARQYISSPFHVCLSVKILKTFVSSSILATCPAHLNLTDLIILTILTNYT